MSKYLILGGSPQKQRKTARIIDALNSDLLSKPGVSTEIFSVADHRIQPCSGCESCEEDYHCIIDDDMGELYTLLEDVDELVVVSPVFFAGPPAQLKALLDRLQPYFWKSLAAKQATDTPAKQNAKRPASLYVVGEGGDPHGFEPLVVSTRSALAVAGFSLKDIFAFVGIDSERIAELIENREAFRYGSHRDNK